jgi:protein N-terminal amidase
MLHVACLQYAPAPKNIEANIQKANSLLCQLTDPIDLLILPEMAFTGYVFLDKQEIAPFVEIQGQGPSFDWAFQTARSRNTLIQFEYPRKCTISKEPVFYNSVAVVNPRGEVICSYDKHFLYEADEAWANEGESFKTFDIPDFGKVGLIFNLGNPIQC